MSDALNKKHVTPRADKICRARPITWSTSKQLFDASNFKLDGSNTAHWQPEPADSEPPLALTASTS